MEWKDWERNDGTNTTWEDLDEESGPMKTFDNERKRDAKGSARNGSDIDMVALGRHMPHDRRTAEALQAYKEKTRFWPFVSKIKPDEWDTGKNENRAVIDRRARVGAPGSSSLTTRVKRRRSDSLESPSTSTPRCEHMGRLRLQSQWNAHLPKGSAKLYLVNRIDDEECPPVPNEFEYTEQAYK